jgi:hypothetical protein
MQWRQPPERVNQLHGDLVEFGRGRSRARGYLAHSDRVGPGVLLLDPHGHSRADALNGDGFTVLVPELDLDEGDEGAIVAAAEYLSANWHPRLGVVGVGPAGVIGSKCLLGREVAFDVLVLYGAFWTGAPRPRMPVVGHFFDDVDLEELKRFQQDLTSLGPEPELYCYPAPASPDGGAASLELADARTLEALEYLLS